MNEIEKQTEIPEEFEPLRPYLLDASISSDGIEQELVFEFPEPSPLKMDWSGIRKRFPNACLEGIFSEPSPFGRTFERVLVAKRLTIR